MGEVKLRPGQSGDKGTGTDTTRRAYLDGVRKARRVLVVPSDNPSRRYPVPMSDSLIPMSRYPVPMSDSLAPMSRYPVPMSRYPVPMSDSLVNISRLTGKWEKLWEMEREMSAPFSQLEAETALVVNYLARDAAVKSSFNYVLLDPRVTQNLPTRVFTVGDQQLWRTFVAAMFYIGKGTRSRPFQHLYEAVKNRGKRKVGRKIETIHGIWEAGLGVISLQVFQNTIGVEAFTREAGMIQAVGCDNLSNAKPGDWYGPAAEWSEEKKSELGTFLVFRAFKIFLQEGERQIRPVDLKLGPRDNPTRPVL